MRLALYAHYSHSGGVALHVLFYLRALRNLGFRLCFISNSPIPQNMAQQLHEICEKVIERENTGYDFGMWQRALAEYQLAQFDELLLTNSSIIGPLHPLEPLWARAAAMQCDFWGLTDNDDYRDHLQSYFLVLRREVLEHPCFQQFWRSVLPYKDRQLVVQSYEVGLTGWLKQHGFRWEALFPQEQLYALFLKRRGLAERLKERIRPLKPPQNTTMLLPDLLLERGMPFLKAKLLNSGGDMNRKVSAEFALRLLEKSNMPPEVLDELRATAETG